MRSTNFRQLYMFVSISVSPPISVPALVSVAAATSAFWDSLNHFRRYSALIPERATEQLYHSLLISHSISSSSGIKLLIMKGATDTGVLSPRFGTCLYRSTLYTMIRLMVSWESFGARSASALYHPSVICQASLTGGGSNSRSVSMSPSSISIQF